MSCFFNKPASAGGIIGNGTRAFHCTFHTLSVWAQSKGSTQLCHLSSLAAWNKQYVLLMDTLMALPKTISKKAAAQKDFTVGYVFFEGPLCSTLFVSLDSIIFTWAGVEHHTHSYYILLRYTDNKQWQVSWYYQPAV